MSIMKRNLRILAALLAAAALTALSSCGVRPRGSESLPASAVSEETKTDQPYALFKASSEKIDALSFVDADMSMKITMEVADTTTNIDTSGKMKASMSDDKLVMRMDMTMNMFGQEVPMMTYYADGYTYSNSAGTKIKMKTSLEEAMANNSASMIAFEEAAVLSAEADEKDGATIVTFALSGDQMKAELADVLEDALSDSALGTDIRFSDIRCEATINSEQYITDYKLAFSMTGSMEMPDLSGNEETVASEVKAGFEITIRYNHPGQAGTVDEPEGLDTYTEIDEEGNPIAAA